MVHVRKATNSGIRATGSRFLCQILTFFDEKLTVCAAERCQKMVHVRKATNSGIRAMGRRFLCQILTVFRREINSLRSRNTSKDGAFSQSRQIRNRLNAVSVFAPGPDCFLNEILTAFSWTEFSLPVPLNSFSCSRRRSSYLSITKTQDATMRKDTTLWSKYKYLTKES